MKKGSVFLLLLLPFLSAAQCNYIDSEDFSNANNWQSTGAGNISINNGTFNFMNAGCSVYDRMWRPLLQTLPDSCLRVVFKFTIEPNPWGQGVGANLLGLSAGTLDPLSYDASQNYATTNQDGFILVLVSGSTDNDINNWWIQLETKDGPARVTAPAVLHLNASILSYYVVFGRTSPGQTYMELYSDSLQTLVDQASNPVNPSITGLNTLHIGVTTWGYSARHTTGTVDNVNICGGCSVLPPAVPEEPAIGFPNVFTPNGDGINDALVFTNLENYSPARLSVYDRWGACVYISEAYRNDWQGTNESNGNLLTDGTYYFVLVTDKAWAGFFTLIH